MKVRYLRYVMLVMPVLASSPHSVVAGGPGATAILEVVPVPAKVGSYPPGTVIMGNELVALSGGFRAWFEVKLSNWDANGDNNPSLKTYQVKIDCRGYHNDMHCAGGTRIGLGCGSTSDCPIAPSGFASCLFVPGGGAPLAPSVIACTNNAAGHALCREAFGEGWAKCGGGTCEAGYLNGLGQRRPADNWCAPGGCTSGVDMSTCNYRYGAIYDSPPRFDGGIEYYGGTLVLDIPAGAMGTYTVDLNASETFLFGVHPICCGAIE